MIFQFQATCHQVSRWHFEKSTNSVNKLLQKMNLRTLYFKPIVAQTLAHTLYLTASWDEVCGWSCLRRKMMNWETTKNSSTTIYCFNQAVAIVSKSIAYDNFGAPIRPSYIHTYQSDFKKVDLSFLKSMVFEKKTLIVITLCLSILMRISVNLGIT